jgi:hypothetical protein
VSSQIVITGVSPYDGRYDLDREREFTTREWGWVKRLAGYLPVQVTSDAFGDPELICVFAVVAMCRAGRIQPAQVPDVFARLADAPFGVSTITVVTDDAGDEEPPDPTPGSSTFTGDTSGAGSLTRSESPAPPPSPTGNHASAISGSVPVTSPS